MAVVLASYQHDSFNSLPPFEVAGPAFDKADGHDIVTKIMTPLFRKHNVETTIGLQLLHNHFELQPEERLVDLNGTSFPLALDGDQLSNITPSVWGIKGKNNAIEIYPLSLLSILETVLDNSLPWSKSNFNDFVISNVDFFREYTQLVEDLGIEGVFGFTRYPGDGFPGRVEITVGRAHVNLTPTQGKIYAVGKAREAAWFFTDDFIQHGCRCLCPEESGVHKGHGSHHITQPV